MSRKLQVYRPIYCKLPSPGSISGRSSSIRNAFFNTLIPVHSPTEDEELEALAILGMDPADIRCAYCGDVATEWDHLRPIIRNKEPTGYITEIANLVPACGKCNQSKGKQHWRDWIVSTAPRSPKTRGVADLQKRVERLATYEAWREPVRIDFHAVVSQEAWSTHLRNLDQLLELMKESQLHAALIRREVERVTERGQKR